MDLNKEIVIKNQFTTINNPAYGKTVGNYISQYSSRKDATQSLIPPVSSLSGTSDSNYLSSLNKHLDIIYKDATQKPWLPMDTYEQEASDMFVQEGVAFNQDSLSLSKKELLDQARKVQELFNQGHTVQKTVISLRTPYLQEMKVLPKDLKVDSPAVFFDKLDDFKLRYAVQNALKDYCQHEKMINPLYVCAIQLDTFHVHVHATIVDDTDLQNSARLMRFKGYTEEKGKARQGSFTVLRHSLNHSLREMKMWPRMALTTSYIKTLEKIKRLNAHLKRIAVTQKLKALLISRQILVGDLRTRRDYQQQLIDYQDSLLELLVPYPVPKSYPEKVSLRERIAQKLDATIQKEIEKYQKLGAPQKMGKLQKQKQVGSRHLNPSRLAAVYNHRRISALERASEIFVSLNDYYQQLSAGHVSQDGQVMGDFYLSELSHAMAIVDKYRYFTYSKNFKNYQVNRERLNKTRIVLEKKRLNLVQKFQTYGLTKKTSQNGIDAIISDYQSHTGFQTKKLQKKSPERQALERLKRNPDTILSSSIIELILDNFDEEKKEKYRDTLTASQTVSERAILGLRSTRLKAEVDQYIQELRDFAFDNFASGCQLSDKTLESITTPFKNGILASPPETINLASANNKDHFNRVKVLDVAECYRDTNTSNDVRNVRISPTNFRKYKNHIEQRQQATYVANKYLNNTSQFSPLLVKIEKEIRENLSFLEKNYPYNDEKQQVVSEAISPKNVPLTKPVYEPNSNELTKLLQQNVQISQDNLAVINDDPNADLLADDIL